MGGWHCERLTVVECVGGEYAFLASPIAGFTSPARLEGPSRGPPSARQRGHMQISAIASPMGWDFVCSFTAGIVRLVA